jgi:C1A family cysteine protease
VPHILIAGKFRTLKGMRLSSALLDPTRILFPTLGTGLPDTVDLSSIAPPVQDQGAVGDCVLNALLECMEALQIKHGQIFTRLSRLYGYARVRQREGTALTNDSGCAIFDAVQLAEQTGICLESLWGSYDPSTRYMINPPDTCDVDAKNHKILFAYRCPNLNTVLSSLAQGFPVVVGVQLPDSVSSDITAQTGDIDNFLLGEGSPGSHAIPLFGYDNNARRVRFMNSWGTSWGRTGWGTFSFDYFDQMRVSDCWTVRLEQV